jgi:hypothetical protein
MIADNRRRLIILVTVVLAALTTAGPTIGQTLSLRGAWTGAAIKATGSSFVVRGSLSQPVVDRLEGTTLVAWSGFWPVASGTLTGVIEDLPAAFGLGQNFPNPFNPRTTIPFALPREARVHLAVFDVSGRLVSVLLDRDLPAGSHLAAFTADRLSSGLYLYRIHCEGWTSTGRMMLLK